MTATDIVLRPSSPPILSLPLHDSQDTHSMSQHPLCTPVDQVIARTDPPSQHPPSPMRTVVAKRRRINSSLSNTNSNTNSTHNDINNKPYHPSYSPFAISKSNNSSSSTTTTHHHQQQSLRQQQLVPSRPPIALLQRLDSLDGQSIDNFNIPSFKDDDSSSLLPGMTSQPCSQRDFPQFSQDTLALLPNIVREHQLARFTTPQQQLSSHATPKYQKHHNRLNLQTEVQKQVQHIKSSQHPLSNVQPMHHHHRHHQSRKRSYHGRPSYSSDSLLRASLASALTSAPPMLNPYLPSSARGVGSASAPSSRRTSNASESYQNLDIALNSTNTNDIHFDLASAPTNKNIGSSIPPPAITHPFISSTSDRYIASRNHPQFGNQANTLRRKSLKLLLVSSTQSRTCKSANFDMRDLAGRGAFSEVWRAFHRLDGCEYAIKKNRTALLSDCSRLNSLHEVFALAALQGHPNILRYFDAWFEDNGKVLFMQTEFLSQGNLHERYVNKGKPMPLDQLLGLAHDIASALEYMHDKDVAHVDVKPDNLFCSSRKCNDRARGGDGNRKMFVIGDFGLACQRYGYGARSTEGDSRYLCPEALSNDSESGARQHTIAMGPDPGATTANEGSNRAPGDKKEKQQGTKLEKDDGRTNNLLHREKSETETDTEGATTIIRRTSELVHLSRDLCPGDVFSLGATLYELAMGAPISKSGPQWKRLRSHPDEASQHVAEKCQSKFFADIVRKCLEPNILKRASASEIKRMCEEHEAAEFLTEKDRLKSELEEARARIARFENVVSALLAKGEEGRQQYRNRQGRSKSKSRPRKKATASISNQQQRIIPKETQ